MADQHIPQIVCDPGAENEFAIGDKWFIDAYDPGDWNGTSGAGNTTKWYSDTTGVSVEFVAPIVAGGIHVSYTEWKDINNTGAIIYADNVTNVDGGNNSGIVFGRFFSSISGVSIFNIKSINGVPIEAIKKFNNY